MVYISSSALISNQKSTRHAIRPLNICIPSQNTTKFFGRNEKSQNDAQSVFLLTSAERAKRYSKRGDVVLGYKPKLALNRIPCCAPFIQPQAHAHIFITDLFLSTWGGAIKASGNVSLFRGTHAIDFWNLVAHVDSLGIDTIHEWRSQSEWSNALGGAYETIHVVDKFKALVAWWQSNHPMLLKDNEQFITHRVASLAHILTILLSNDNDMRAYADLTIREKMGNFHPHLIEREIANQVELMKVQRQELMRKGQELHLPNPIPVSLIPIRSLVGFCN